MVFSLVLHFLFCSGLASEPLRARATRRRGSYQTQVKGSNQRGTSPNLCLRNPRKARFSVAETRDKNTESSRWAAPAPSAATQRPTFRNKQDQEVRAWPRSVNRAPLRDWQEEPDRESTPSPGLHRKTPRQAGGYELGEEGQGPGLHGNREGGLDTHPHGNGGGVGSLR